MKHLFPDTDLWVTRNASDSSMTRTACSHRCCTTWWASWWWWTSTRRTHDAKCADCSASPTSDCCTARRWTTSSIRSTISWVHFSFSSWFNIDLIIKYLFNSTLKKFLSVVILLMLVMYYTSKLYQWSSGYVIG